MTTTPQLRRSDPVFLVDDIASTMRWYQEMLGFSGEPFPPNPPHVFGAVWRDDVVILLQALPRETISVSADCTRSFSNLPSAILCILSSSSFSGLTTMVEKYCPMRMPASMTVTTDMKITLFEKVIIDRT